MKRLGVGILMLAVLVGAAVLWQSGTVTSGPSSAAPPTPYKCYQITDTISPSERVALGTQFGIEPNVLVGAPQLLCEPAKKNDVGDLTQTPYKAYQITDTHNPNVHVKLVTQFGEEPNVLVGLAQLLWEPAIKTPPGHGDLTRTPYKCYQISDTHNPNVRVKLETQFGVETNVLVGPANLLCEPALKQRPPGSGPWEGDLKATPYKCYQITSTDNPNVRKSLETQFGIEPNVLVGLAQRLCEPATKYTPVGGIAELPEVASDSGWSAGTYAALAGGLAAAVLALTAGAWYARRRWVR